MGIKQVFELGNIRFGVIEGSRIIGNRMTGHGYREGMTCGILDSKIKTEVSMT